MRAALHGQPLADENSRQPGDAPIPPSGEAQPAPVSREPLTAEALREMYCANPRPDVARLIGEIYRLHGLLRRTAAFADTARRRGAEERLDITSRRLLVSLDEALAAEPCVTQSRQPFPASVQVPPLPPARRIEPKKQPAPKRVFAAVPEMPVSLSELDANRQRLFTWRLTPEPGRADDAWQGSQYRGVVVVRAADAVQARDLAAQRFQVEGGADSSNPWRKRRLVNVEAVDDERYERVDRPGVVYP
jgi:hypothetical protein